MDIASTTYLCYNLPSPAHPMKEFEFQMSSTNLDTDHIPSPADELFYKGNLLPLHLPPRLRMVESLLRASSSTTTTTTASTPLQSCNISPATSCYFFKEPHARKSWCKKLKLFEQSSSVIISHKLKASKAYLKSLFTKSGCSDATPAVPMSRIDGEKMVEERRGHRRSFSGAIRWRSSASPCSSSNSSSFSSVSSNGGLYGHQVMEGSDEEGSIRGAIAHCKKTHQQQVRGRKTLSDVEFYLLSESPDLMLNVNNTKKY